MAGGCRGILWFTTASELATFGDGPITSRSQDSIS